ncbi:energy-coupling factor transporter transmembrane protein EcfT, partial [Bifidobacterium bifidum]
MTEVVVPRETRVPIRATRGVLHFDPRVKLAMLVVANMMMFLHVGPYAGMMGVLLFSLPMLCGGKIALGMGMLACYAMCLGVDWLAAAVADAAPWLHVP